jgi:deoxyuridine 5''-triphosphate nucleotidohydrolase (EC 3.6.1.23)
MELKVKKMRDNSILPTRGDSKAAGIDLYACIDNPATILPNATVMIPSGIACEFPEGYFGLMLPRSSVGVKRKLTLANTAGVIDESFRGEIMMAFKNNGDVYQTIEPGERLAQLILLPYFTYSIVETDTLSTTERGDGGFGSTGV